jgi:molybdopterin/thiamine biosynthesis adenylyltransferase
MNGNERYERQVIIDGWGDDGQKKLKGSHVGIAGTGGLGSPAAIYLAAAGVGRLSICDYQDLEISNLNRQVLFTTEDAGESKVLAATRRLEALNPEIQVIPHNKTIDTGNISEIFGDCDLIVDCLDNPETRLVINQFCVERSVAFVHAGVREFYGQVMLISPPTTPCLACFFDVEGFESDGPIPICGSTAGVLGSLEANVALRWLLGMESGIEGVFFSVDLTSMEINRIEMAKNPDCRVCGTTSTE